jgi:N-methylhydantoinase A
VVPPLAGNFSAWGLLGADMVQSAARTRVMDLTDANLAVVNAILAELFTEIGKRSSQITRETVRSARLDLRYKGQEHWLTIDVPLASLAVAVAAARILDDFTTEYERTFAATMNEVVEIVSVRATLRVPLPRRGAMVAAGGDKAGNGKASVNAYSFTQDERLDFAIVPRSRIDGGLDGPAIVTETTATLYLDVGWRAEVGAHGELVVTRSEAN